MGIINNKTHDFRIDYTKSRDSNAIKNFISRHVQKGNKICTNGWAGYDYLDSPDSGYQRFKHNHGGGDFDYAEQSSSHIEGIWSVLKSKIKNSYYVFPTKNILKFIKEAEFKYKIKALSPESKMKEIFDCYSHLKVVGDFDINDYIDCLKDEDESDSDSD